MKLNIKSSLILISAVCISAIGCLKDKEYDNGQIQSVHNSGANIKPVEIKLTAANATNVYSIALDNSPNDTTVQLIPVNLATADAAPTDLHVTLTQDDQIVADYNAANTDTCCANSTGKITDYKVPTAFTLVNSGGVVVIPKGQHTAYLSISFKPSDFLGTTYALGYTISKVDESGYTISGNLQKGMVVINIKNQYDGVYSRKGYVLRAGDNALSGATGPDEVSLSTIDGTTVIWVENHGWSAASGALLASTISNPVWSVNPDNTVTVTSSGGPFPGGLENLSSYGPSTYDPATKTFYVAATWGGGPGVREMYDTLTYSGPR